MPKITRSEVGSFKKLTLLSRALKVLVNHATTSLRHRTHQKNSKINH
jgi:hypothetical protein